MNDDPRQWIAAVCRDTREQAGANRTVVAAKVNKSEDVIRRFETLRGQWSPHTPAIVVAYADLGGVQPWELWQRAIDSWRESVESVSPATQPRRSPKAQTQQGTGTRLDIDELQGKLNKRLGSGRSKPQKASGPKPEDPQPKRDPQRPQRRQRASGNA